MVKKSCEECIIELNCRRKRIITVNHDFMEQFHFCFYGRNADKKDKENAGTKRTIHRRVKEALAERCPYYKKQE
jgi:hypothetical protein